MPDSWDRDQVVIGVSEARVNGNRAKRNGLCGGHKHVPSLSETTCRQNSFTLVLHMCKENVLGQRRDRINLSKEIDCDDKLQVFNMRCPNLSEDVLSRSGSAL